MRITGTLEFVDIGTGSWLLHTKDKVYQLFCKWPMRSAFTNGFETTLKVDLMESPDTATNSMTGKIPVIVTEVVGHDDSD